MIGSLKNWWHKRSTSDPRQAMINELNELYLNPDVPLQQLHDRWTVAANKTKRGEVDKSAELLLCLAVGKVVIAPCGEPTCRYAESLFCEAANYHDYSLDKQRAYKELLIKTIRVRYRADAKSPRERAALERSFNYFCPHGSLTA